MPQSIFDDITSADIATYWNTLQQQEAPYLGEVLFPNVRRENDTLTWYRGDTRAPQALKPSAFGAQTVVRDRQGFRKMTTNTNFYKEGKYIDEKIRQELVRVQSSPIQGQKEIILGRIFKDDVELLRGAALTREIQRMQVLQTGKYSASGNGQTYAEDYQMKQTHIATAAKAWGTDGASPIDDIRRAKDQIGTDEGITITRAIMNQKTFDVLLADQQLKATILANNANTALATVPQRVMLSWIQDEYGLTIQVYDKVYTDGSGLKRFIEDGNVIFLPEGNLGTTAFAPTPEEIDLMASTQADVTIVDDGVAVTTTMVTDPVTKLVRVSQNFAPTFEAIDGVYVLKSFSSATGTTQVPGGVPDGDGDGKGADDNTPKTVAVTGVTLDAATITGVVGETKQLTATVAPADATNKAVTWKSSDETVATVNDKGLVTYVKAGTADIAATTADGGKTAKSTATITDKTPEEA